MSAQTDNVAERRRAGALNTIPLRTALLALVIVVSLIVRVAHLVSVYRTPFFSYHQAWSNADMYQTNQWAQRIIDGDILGRKTYHPLTDWMLQAAPAAQWAAWFGDRPVYLKAPVYTYLVALLRWLFGDAMLALALLQVVASTLSAALLFLITEALFGPLAGFALRACDSL